MTWSILLFIVEIYTVPLNDVDEYYKFCFNCPLYNSPKSIAFHFFLDHLFFGQFLIVVVFISFSVSSFLHWSNFNITNFDHEKDFSQPPSQGLSEVVVFASASYCTEIKLFSLLDRLISG